MLLRGPKAKNPSQFQHMGHLFLMKLSSNLPFNFIADVGVRHPNNNARKIISHCIVPRLSIFKYNVVVKLNSNE